MHFHGIFNSAAKSSVGHASAWLSPVRMADAPEAAAAADVVAEGAAAPLAPERSGFTAKTGMSGISAHHGFSLRPPHSLVHDSIAKDGSQVALKMGPGGGPIKVMDEAEYAELLERLYAQAETKRQSRKQPPPDRHPQGGIAFELDEVTKMYRTVRKPALVMGGEEYTACMCKMYDGAATSFAKHAALLAKYFPGVTPEMLAPKPTRGPKS